MNHTGKLVRVPGTIGQFRRSLADVAGRNADTVVPLARLPLLETLRKANVLEINEGTGKVATTLMGS